MNWLSAKWLIFAKSKKFVDEFNLFFFLFNVNWIYVKFYRVSFNKKDKMLIRNTDKFIKQTLLV